MRIRSVSVESFGSLRKWRGEFSDGVTVVTGDNEAGKTTLTNFIRGTLFPLARASKKDYPEPAKSDSGTVTVVMDDGTERTVVRSNRSITSSDGGPTPAEMVNIEPETYRSMFAMGLSELTDDKLLTSGDIKARFLTVPGGENVPAVLGGIESSMNTLLTPQRMSSNGIGETIENGKAIDEKIDRAKAAAEEYGRLAEERERLRVQLEKAKADQSATDEVRKKRAVVLAQRENVDAYRKRSAEIAGLEYSRGLPQDAVETFNGLNAAAKDSKMMYDSAVGNAEDWSKDLRGGDPRKIDSCRKEIDELTSGNGYSASAGRADRLNAEIEKLNTIVDECTESTGMSPRAAASADLDGALAAAGRAEPAPSKKNSTVPYAVLVLGMIMAVAGIAGLSVMKESSMAYVAAAGVAVAVVGAVLLIISKKRAPAHSTSAWDPTAYGLPASVEREKVSAVVFNARRMTDAYGKLSEDNGELAELNSGIRISEEKLNFVCEATGVSRGNGFEEGIDNLRRAAIAAENATKAAASRDEKAAAAKKAGEELSAFLAGYGGAEGFSEIVNDSRKLAEVELGLASLKESMEKTAGMPFADIAAAVDAAKTETESQAPAETPAETLNHDIGTVETKMRNILEDGELDRLEAERSANEAKLDRELREWAVLSLAKGISDEVCDGFYGDHQPGVIARANTYLSLMTDGRYRLESDPRNTDIVIHDRDDTLKDSRKWSSGLGDQVYLSLKMAMAKEMGSERLPMIMDDILVRFDRERRAGACRAIFEFAKDQQVILFSCDDRMHDVFAEEGDAHQIRL
jgi:uncharacterized protein YhaN